jgi:hypothetical protein
LAQSSSAVVSMRSPKVAASTWSPNAKAIGGELGGGLTQTPDWAAAAASRRCGAPRWLTGSGRPRAHHCMLPQARRRPELPLTSRASVSSFFLPSFLLSVDPYLHLTTLTFLPLLRAGVDGRLWAASDISGRLWAASSISGPSGADEMPRGERQHIFTLSLSSEAKWLNTLHHLLEIILNTHT